MHPDWQSDIMRYCEENSSPEAEFLQNLVRFTWLHTLNPRQLSGHLQGSFLSFISKILRPDWILEVGAFTGYASYCMAQGLSDKGKLLSIEADPELVFKAQSQFENTPFSQKIEFIAGDARKIIPELTVKADLIFVDADKQSYALYLDLCLPKLSDRGLMLFDNTLWSGKVADEKLRKTDADTRNMHAFNQQLAKNPNLEVMLLPLRDGLTMVRKK